MPLFRDPDRRRHYPRSPNHDQCEQSTMGSSPPQTNGHDHRGLYNSEMPTDSMETTRPNPPISWANDREELIHRIKESSPWRLPHTSHEKQNNILYISSTSQQNSQTAVIEHGDGSLHQEHQEHHINVPEELGSPADIQRPRSALHSGDFREGAQDPLAPQSPFAGRSETSSFAHLSSSPTTPWFGAPSLPEDSRETSAPNENFHSDAVINARSRAPSLGSFSSSYILKAPTSPLVHQANNTDLDFSTHVEYGDVSDSVERSNRRRTLPPETFGNLRFSPPNNQVVSLGSPSSPARHRDIFTNQTSLPRRSLTSTYSLQLAPSPGGYVPPSRVRRPSFASEVSANPHAPMVGSYEESILRGRMSMNPSKPLDFTAQIGVLGKGKCKGHLKCPPHVTVPFPVVFYSYPTSGSGRSISDDNPSPYVGQIDLENSLPQELPNPTRRRRPRANATEPREGTPATAGANSFRMSDPEMRRHLEKKHRRSESPKCPPGGSYRIPQQGQLQIIIKNPHKTAVKLFLVPYDLGDMEPGTKTFIRQRSYSAGPIIDMPLSARKNYGTDRPEASLNPTEDPQNKPTLRYLIHLNVCCPARGRFYLHSTIRVVFANRVPDGKEKLRNEIQTPEPRYSPYKPSRESSLSSTASTNARLSIEQNPSRRSLGQEAVPHLRLHGSSPSDLPLHRGMPGPMDFTNGLENAPPSDPASLYKKLTEGDVESGGHALIPAPSRPEPGESLLAKRLRGLDVHRHDSAVDEPHPCKPGFYNHSSPTCDRRPR